MRTGGLKKTHSILGYSISACTVYIINPVHTCRFLALNEINFPGTREAAGDEARLLQPPPGARQGGQINGNPPEEAGHCSVVMRKKQTVQ
jgi:hypothetical protein